MKKYNHLFTCKELDQFAGYIDDYLIDDSQALAELLDYVGLPKRYRGDITAAIVIVGDGDYEAIWLSESGRYYDHTAWYHPLPYYRARIGKNYPIYWKKSNPYYHK